MNEIAENLNRCVGHGVPVPPTLTLFRSASMSIYRRLYEQHFGPIPKGYHIHHIDGNHSNNHIDNLQCVSAKEHYDIHYSQGDYGACWAMSVTGHISLTTEQRSEISSKTQLELSKDGRHPFQLEKSREKNRIAVIERNKSMTGKTYEELYGEDKAQQIKDSISAAGKGKVLNLTDEERSDRSERCKIYNPMFNLSDEKNEERKDKIRQKMKQKFENSDGNTKGRVCYTDGDKNIFLSIDAEIPEGFSKGMTRRKRK